MKKWFYTPLLLLALLSQTACGGHDEEPIIPEQPGTTRNTRAAGRRRWRR